MVSTLEPINTTISFFNETKQKILVLLKREGMIDLSTLSEKLRISKMGVLNHIGKLEEYGLVERIQKKEGVGRPKLYLALTEDANHIFPTGYQSLVQYLLDTISKQLGRTAVYDTVKQMLMDQYEPLKPYFKDKSLREKIEQLVNIKKNEGNLIELEVLNDNNADVIQYNCPYAEIAEKYHEVCKAEIDALKFMLDENVVLTAKSLNNGGYCKYHIGI